MAVKKKIKKTTVPRLSKKFDTKHLGEEPKVEGKTLSDIELQRCYGWYNYFHDSNSANKMLFDHYPRDKKELRYLKKLNHIDIPNSLGYNARLRHLGASLPEQSVKWFDEKIAHLIAMAKTINKKEAVIEEKEVYKPTVQERIREQISELIGELEEIFDEASRNRGVVEFNVYEWLRSNEVKAQQSKAISDYYSALYDELNSTDEQIKEAYSSYRPIHIRRMRELAKTFRDDALTWSTNQKKTRKTRKPKPISVDKQIEKVQYCKEFPDYKLVSLSPAEVVGCQEVFVFNTKYRQLEHFKTSEAKGFSFKGTTLQGFDEDTSIAKRVRKPEDVLPNLIKATKRQINNIMGGINTKRTTPTGRFNKNTVILKVIK